MARDRERPLGPDEERLRRDARALIEAAIAAVDPERLVAGYLELAGELGTVGALRAVAIGKAAATMARGASRALGERLAGGVLIATAGSDDEAPAGFDVYAGGHPTPDAGGVAGAEAVAELAAGLGADDALLLLISGGGSSLMTLPPADVPLADVVATTDLLLRAGADIVELNTVRKHLDRLKGGQVARLASPARILALVLSDVVGDPLDVIASGPASPDPTTHADAVAILERYDLGYAVPASVRRHLERGVAGEVDDTPKPGDMCFERVEAQVVGSNRMAVAAARAEAERRGYQTLVLTTELEGEAREVGRLLAAVAREIRRRGEPIEPPACVLAAGETTVTVRGAGRGGRNQELVLGAVRALAGLPAVLVASAGTDGVDGPTDAAGALATGTTSARARARELGVVRALAENDSYPFFEALDDLIVTGPTGTNVMDVQVVLVGDVDGG